MSISPDQEPHSPEQKKEAAIAEIISTLNDWEWPHATPGFSEKTFRLMLEEAIQDLQSNNPNKMLTFLHNLEIDENHIIDNLQDLDGVTNFEERHIDQITKNRTQINRINELRNLVNNFCF